MTKQQKIMNRLQELATQVERKKDDYVKEVVACMTSAELKEISAMYDNGDVAESRIFEIWERAEHEHKSKAVKKA